MLFDHEKLKVYQQAVEFVAWSSNLLSGRKVAGDLKDQFSRAATSICLNIAEGNGKSSQKDRCRFLEIARGSAFECAACLNVMVALGAVEKEGIYDGKRKLVEIVSMLVGLIQRNGGMVRESKPSMEWIKGTSSKSKSKTIAKEKMGFR